MLLEVKNLRVGYGPIVAVHELSLEVGEGEIVTLLGPNGAGKTTTLMAIINLLPLMRGDISFADTPVKGLVTESIIRAGMTMVPEGRHVFEPLTVMENLQLGGTTQRDKQEYDKALDEVMELFPILNERLLQMAGTLSGGEQQQLAIARALMSSPRMLLLDEPSLGLAPQMLDLVFELIVTLRQRGRTILLVEQNARRALEVADRGYILANGRCVFSGTSEELMASSEVEKAYIGI
jgi:branched-chain amino acid transport system ATP-binding protein